MMSFRVLDVTLFGVRWFSLSSSSHFLLYIIFPFLHFQPLLMLLTKFLMSSQYLYMILGLFLICFSFSFTSTSHLFRIILQAEPEPDKPIGPPDVWWYRRPPQ